MFARLNLGPSLVGKLQVLRIPPYASVSVLRLGKKIVRYYSICSDEAKSDTGRPSIVWFGIVSHPRSDDGGSSVNSGHR